MPLSAAESLAAGLVEHRAGNLAAAARHYCQTLELAPIDPDALHLLGLLLSEQGEHGRALSFLRCAVQLRPNATYVANLGLAFRRAGDLDGAIASYREALRMNPLHGPTLGKLGRVLIDAGRAEEAEFVLIQANAQQPSQAELRNALGHVRAEQGRFAEAREDFAAALALDPTYGEAAENCARALLQCGHAVVTSGEWPSAHEYYKDACRLAPSISEAWYHRGLAASALRLLPEARGCYERAIDLSFNYAEAHNNLGHLFQVEGDREAAIRAYERALAIRPGYIDAQYNLALTVQNSGRVSEAKAHYEALLALDPHHVDSLNNLGAIYLGKNRVVDAAGHFETALTHKPTHVDARWNLSLARLGQGDFRRGWPLYETRLEQSTFPVREFACPRWREQSLDGKTICVWSEQGLGDTIQFMRYLPLLTQMGARVVFEVQERLYSLLRHLQGVDVVARKDPPPTSDYHTPLLSLAGCFEHIPPVWFPVDVPTADLSYLAGRKVGLCWAGHPDHVKGRNRSIPFVQLAPLTGVEGVRLVSLQRGPSESEMEAIAGSWHVERVEKEDGTIAELASIVRGLDLVITVDTMMAHLASTLGKPVWTLLPFAADWRWQLDREDSPWYPGMRLFRQSAAGQWDVVVNRVAAELNQWHGETFG